MNINEIIRLPDPRKAVTVEAREVVRDFEKRLHVFVRVRLSGWHFPERAPEPFMVVGHAVSRFVRISRDGSFADGYFDVRLRSTKVVSFGYGKVVSWDFDTPFKLSAIARLQRRRLPPGFIDLHP
jgi:hypothetical protein